MNCVIFGFGYMGKIRHRVLREHPRVGRIWIVEPAGPVPVTGGDVAWVTSSEEVDWSDVGAAFVCTPNDVTVDLCVEALERCGNVFCEKPPGRNWEDFSRIAEAVSGKTRRRIVFGFNHRLHPSVQAAKAFLGEGGLGEVIHLKATYGKSGGLNYRENWRNRYEVSGGGILLDQGVHMLDLFQFFCGPMRVVQAVLRDSFWGCGVEDNAFVLLESERGVPAFLHSSATLWKHTFRVEVGCRDGYLVLSGLLSQTGSYGREQLVVGRRQFEDEALALGNPREEIIYFDRDDSWKKETFEFVDSILEGRSPTHGTLPEAAHIMSLVREVYACVGRRPGLEPQEPRRPRIWGDRRPGPSATLAESR
ncbi:MAG: Gfo/Idh/MocA family oxidoreductase [Nitrospirae bacterium]|nr:Gfo/Idh/MocA family oxidoreductase [Nitrospirota bacterium]